LLLLLRLRLRLRLLLLLLLLLLLKTFGLILIFGGRSERSRRRKRRRDRRRYCACSRFARWFRRGVHRFVLHRNATEETSCLLDRICSWRRITGRATDFCRRLRRWLTSPVAF
jgi:hypothetical protein